MSEESKAPYRIRTIDEAAEEVAANWPPLTPDQQVRLAQIFAPIIAAERLAAATKKRRPAA